MSIESRLVARAHARQILVGRRANSAANAADRAVLGIWRQLLGLLREGRHWSEAEWAARYLFAHLPPVLLGTVAVTLRGIGRWGWRSAVAATKAALPAKTLRAALTEDEADDPLLFFHDLLAPFRDFLPGSTPPPDTPAKIAALLFPAPTPGEIARVVFDSDWQARLSAATRLASPPVLAGVVGGGLARGLSHQEIARELMPAVNRVRASARRVARTEALRVAGAMQMKCHEQLGDLVIGYQVHATLDQHTRPWHRARDKTIYYLVSKPGQKGPAQMPHPPDEPEDPTERPPGAPKTAWNCLLPGNHVHGRFLAASKAVYTGQAIQLVSASGLFVSVTPYHPVMTAQGFVPACEIEKGDYLACYISGVKDGAENEEDAPAAAEEVFRSLSQFSGAISRRPAALEEFHGDARGFDSEVDVVRAEGKLRGDWLPHVFEGGSYSLLVGRGMQALLESGACPGAFATVRVGAATAGLVRRLHLPPPTSCINDPTPFGLFRRGLIAEGHSAFAESSVDEQAAHAKFLGKLIAGFPFKITPTNLDGMREFDAAQQDIRFGTSSNTHASLEKPSFQSVAFYLSLAAKAAKRLPAKIALDKVVDVQVFHHEGPVYDFETDIGYFVANRGRTNNGILIKNCRCYLSPVLRD